MHPNARDPFRRALPPLLGIALAFSLAVPDAQARGGSGGRLAQGSVAGANRAATRPARPSTPNRGNVGNGSGNNINIGNDVNIDIDNGYGHHWDDHDYHPVAAAITIGAVAVTTRAVVGAYYYALPVGCTVVYRNGIAYHYCGSVYYSQTWYGNDVVYVVVNP
jgi:hypothetical protein